MRDLGDAGIFLEACRPSCGDVRNICVGGGARCWEDGIPYGLVGSIPPSPEVEMSSLLVTINMFHVMQRQS